MTADSGSKTADSASRPAGNATGETGVPIVTALAAGLLGGLAGAVAFGGLLWVANPDFHRATIPALYGVEARGTVGWAIHLVHGAAFGIVFAAAVSRPAATGVLLPPLEDRELGPTGTKTRLLATGGAYGLALWAIFPVIVMPIWLGDPERIAEIPVPSLFGHVVFGLVLGGVYAAIAARG